MGISRTGRKTDPDIDIELREYFVHTAAMFSIQSKLKISCEVYSVVIMKSGEI